MSEEEGRSEERGAERGGRREEGGGVRASAAQRALAAMPSASRGRALAAMPSASRGRALAAIPVAVLALLLGACGGEAKAPATTATTASAAKAVPDTATPAPVDLSKLASNIPKATVDTFTFRPLHVERIPDAPPALMDAAEREQGISRFCYQEFGQKTDPKLIGAVALVVTIEANAIKDIRIGADDWSSPAGRAVDRCLVQKAPQAWKLLPDAKLAAGRYVVQLQFRPS